MCCWVVEPPVTVGPPSWGQWAPRRMQQRRSKPHLSQELHTEILEGDRAIHLLLLLQKQHEEPALHVPQQVTGTIGVHAVVTHNRALLPRGRTVVRDEASSTTRAQTTPLPTPAPARARSHSASITCAGEVKGGSF